ncbi:MAG: hypothetical protein K2G88_10840 [Oscillospiraceae bacterium]|nr:hypothetical protein [Oscillospiraceae bacterium]
MENATVIKIPKNGNYTCMNNRHFFDSSISELASRLLSIVLALPEDWNFTVSGIATMLAKGKKAVKNAIANLIQSGYAYVEQPRDKKTGFFQHNIYTFYETPEVNPHFKNNNSDLQQQNNENSEIPENRDSNRRPKTVEPLPHDRKGALSNTNKSNTNKLSSLSVSLVEQTDGLTTQSENNNAIKSETSVAKSEIAAILKKNIVETSPEDKKFIEEVIYHLNRAVSTGIISLNNVIDKLEAIINTEHSLNSFMSKLQQICNNCLKNLKNPKAKDSFIRKIVVNKLREYIPELSESNQEPIEQEDNSLQKPVEKSKENNTAKPLSFRQMILQMQSPLVEKYGIDHDMFNSEKDFWSYFEDLEDAQIRNCIIPMEFRHNRKNMKNALKFLMCWNDLENGEFKSFSQHAISYLAEVLQTGKCCGQEVNCHNLISCLNYINFGGKDDYERETTEESICDFMECFFNHYCKQIEAYPPKSANKKGYITKMLISYLSGEYQAISAHTHACMKNIDNTQKNTNHSYDGNSSLQELYEYERRYYMS